MSSHLDTVWKEEVTDWHLIKRPMPAPIPSVARMKYFRHKLAVSWFNVPTQNQIYFTINQPVGCLHESGLSQRTEWRKLGWRTFQTSQTSVSAGRRSFNVYTVCCYWRGTSCVKKFRRVQYDLQTMRQSNQRVKT